MPNLERPPFFLAVTKVTDEEMVLSILVSDTRHVDEYAKELVDVHRLKHPAVEVHVYVSTPTGRFRMAHLYHWNETEGFAKRF